MTRAASSPDVATGRARRGRLPLAAALGVAAALVVAGCEDNMGADRRGAPASGTAASQQGAGVVSGAGGGAPGGTLGGGLGGSAGGAGAPNGGASRPASTGGIDTGTPVTPDSASKVPPTAR